MWIAHVYRHDLLTSRVPFRNQYLSIGRSPECQICIPDDEISRIHLLVEKLNHSFRLTDKSSNGTLVNGVKTRQCDVWPGDRITMGSWSVVFEEEAKLVDETGLRKRKEHTQAIDEQHHQQAVFSQSCLIQTHPIERSFPVKKTLVSLGKNQSNDIVLSDECVSSFHCRIEFREGVFLLRDLQSTNGTRINGQPIVEAPIREGSKIEIGRAAFEFFTHPPTRIKKRTGSQFSGIVSQDPKIEEILDFIRSIRNISVPVLVLGETGTGKELIARAIHENSLRNQEPFVVINCGALPKDTIESELFGHEKGAFTGAISSHNGVFEQANKGTLFLDEIAELPLELQVKLLRAVEYGEIRRLGSIKTQKVDVRIIAATHRNLPEEVSQWRFREDLYYRLDVLSIHLPALRDRPKDIPILAAYFLGRETTTKWSDVAIQKLLSHSWPGNVRELRNAVERAKVLAAEQSEILPKHVRLSEAKVTAAVNPSEVSSCTTLEDMEKTMIVSTLERYRWNRKITAQKLGIAKSTLHEKVKKYGIKTD